MPSSRSIVIEHIYAQHALDEDKGIVYAYLRYDTPESLEPSKLLQSFVKQLCFRKEIHQPLLDFYSAYHRDARSPLFDNLYAHFTELSKSLSTLFLVTDALDEVPQLQRKHGF